MKRALAILLGALLLALALAAGSVVFLAATESGTRFLAEQAERFVPVRFTDVSGALLREVRVGKLEVELANQHIEIDTLTTSVEMMPLLFENHLIVHSVKADAVTITRTGEAQDDAPPPPLELPYMPVDVDVEELVVERLAIGEAATMRVAGAATWTSQGLAVRRVNVISGMIAGTVSGRLGTGSNPVIAADVSWSLPDRAWGGQGSLEGRVGSFALRHVLRGYVSVDAEGRGDLSNFMEPFVDVEVVAQDLEFGETAIRNISGRMRGTPANVSADLGSLVSVPGIEAFRAYVVAYGPANGPLTLRNVTADALGGVQEAQGSVIWQDGVRVHLGGSVTSVPLAALHESLSGELSAGFEFRYQEGLLALGVGDISGTLNRRPLAGAVEISQLEEEGWAFDPVRLSVGANELTGNARLSGSFIEVQAEVTAPALEALSLGVSGDASGTVRIAGVWPELNGTIDVDSTRLEGFGSLVEAAAVSAQLRDGVLDGTVTAERVRRQQLAVRDARLAARGELDDLDWRASWEGGEGAGALRRRDDGLEVVLTSARTELLDHQWSLVEPTRVLLLDERIELASTCITGGGASACVRSFAYQSGHMNTRGELTRAPVALLRPWLPIRLGDQGYLEGHWTLSGDLDDLDGELTLAARALTYIAGEAQEVIDLPDLEADGDVADGALRVRLAATDAAFSLVGEARLEPVQASGALSGTLRASASDLEPLKVFDQRLQEIAGDVEGSVDLSGTLEEPRLEGRLRLARGRLRLNDPGIALTDIVVGVNVDDSGRFDMRGTARQNEDEFVLTASGSGLLTGDLVVRAALEGDRLRARHPDWEIAVQPDLDFTYENGRGWVRGRVEVPKAEVRLTALPTTVPSPSEDVIVVGREAPNGGEDNWLRADVEVVLGEDVVLKALGLTAELEGGLRARLDSQGQTTLRGTLDITGGELTAQGQTLTIESGSVVYNGPVTRPYIDLRAVRVIEDTSPEVRVGLHIRGDANNLTSTVYSEPAMSETRALSYLVLGRDIEEETAADDSSRLMTAAINLGLSRSRGITSELMRRTGLDELSATAEAEDSFAIVAGKRVTDDIYVRYTYNTLSAVGAFLVRYELSSKWQLEAQSGEQSSMDLLYSIQK